MAVDAGWDLFWRDWRGRNSLGTEYGAPSYIDQVRNEAAWEVGKPEGAMHHDDGKTPLGELVLLPEQELLLMAEVLRWGAGKYAPGNWQRGMKWSRPLGSALRHIWKWSRGESLDPETHLSHLAHAAINLMFLMYYERLGIGEDDRYKTEGAKSY